MNKFRFVQFAHLMLVMNIFPVKLNSIPDLSIQDKADHNIHRGSNNIHQAWNSYIHVHELLLTHSLITSLTKYHAADTPDTYEHKCNHVPLRNTFS